MFFLIILVPEILLVCTEFIEKHGMVDGIYRHTGLQSNIQRLRFVFCSNRGFSRVKIISSFFFTLEMLLTKKDFTRFTKKLT